MQVQPITYPPGDHLDQTLLERTDARIAQLEEDLALFRALRARLIEGEDVEQEVTGE